MKHDDAPLPGRHALIAAERIARLTRSRRPADARERSLWVEIMEGMVADLPSPDHHTTDRSASAGASPDQPGRGARIGS